MADLLWEMVDDTVQCRAACTGTEHPYLADLTISQGREQPIATRPLRAYLALTIGVLCISTTAIFTKWAAMPGPVTAVWRMIIAARSWPCLGCSWSPPHAVPGVSWAGSGCRQPGHVELRGAH